MSPCGSQTRYALDSFRRRSVSRTLWLFCFCADNLRLSEGAFRHGAPKYVSPKSDARWFTDSVL